MEAGPSGKAANFDGTGSYLEIQNENNFDLSKISFGGWFKLNEIPTGNAFILGKYNDATGTDASYRLIINSAGQLNLAFYTA